MKKNVIMLVLDSARPDHFSCYGYKHKTTPTIDKIASEGILFNNVIAPSNWTVPSHSSFFTGCYVKDHKMVFDGFLKLRKDADQKKGIYSRCVFPKEPPLKNSLAKVLRENGYKTYFFSENIWLNKCKIADDFAYQIKDTPLINKIFNKSYRKLPIFKNIIKFFKKLFFYNAYYEHDFFIADFEEKIKKNKKQPFFAFFNFLDCHMPYNYLPEILSELEFDKNPNFIKGTLFDNPKNFCDSRKIFSGDKKDLLNIIMRYDASLKYLDYKIKGLIDFLKKEKLFDDTLFIVTSDHGEEFNEHNHILHRNTLYESAVRVPLIIKAPFLNKNNIETRIELKDLYYFILDQLKIRKVDEERNILSRNYSKKVFCEADSKISVYQEKFKLIYDSKENKYNLYNLDIDPLERNNIINQNEVFYILKKEIDVFSKSSKKQDLETEEDYNKETYDRLEELGYI